MMAHSLLETHWRYDADLSNPETLAGIAKGLGHDVEALIKKAASEAVQAKSQENSI